MDRVLETDMKHCYSRW